MNPGLADDPLVDHRPEMQDLSGPELNESEVNRVAEVVEAECRIPDRNHRLESAASSAFASLFS